MASPSQRTSSVDEERSPQWTQLRKEMHRAIDENNRNEVLGCLQAAPRLKLWLCPQTDEPAMCRAAGKGYYDICSLLRKYNCLFKDPDYERDSDGDQQHTSAAEEQAFSCPRTSSAMPVAPPPRGKPNMNEETSDKWKDIRNRMHKAIDEGVSTEVRQCLKEAPTLMLWLHPCTGESAMHRSITRESFHIYAILEWNECYFKDEDEKECLRKLSSYQRFQIRRHGTYVRKNETSHITHISNSIQQHCGDIRENILRMLRELDKSSLLSTILQVAATSPYLGIIMDPKKADIQTMTGCPMRGILFAATYYEQHQIFIGGKRDGTTGDASDREVLGTLLHELCHFALHLVYQNNGKPYFIPDVEKKRRYKKVIEDTKRHSKRLHDAIEYAFTDKNTEEEELVVRVPHIIVLRDSSGDGESMLEAQAPELLKFFQEEVILDMTKYVENTPLAIDAKNIAEKNATLGKAKRTDQLNVTFERTLARSDIEKGPLLILTSPYMSLLEVIVHQAVKSTGHPYLFFDAHQWNDEIIDVLLKNQCNILLLSCKEKIKLDKIFEVLRQVFEAFGTNTILLVEKKDRDYFLRQAKEDKLYAEHHHVDHVDEAHFDNIAQECKDRLLQRSHIRLQGEDYKVPLGKVLDKENFPLYIDAVTFLQLCESGYIEVGPSLGHSKTDSSDCYIERKLRTFVKGDIKRLHACCENDAFVFCGCSVETVNKYLPGSERVDVFRWRYRFERFVLLDEFDDYESISRKDHYLDKNVHLLQYCKDEESSGGVDSKDYGNFFPFKEVLHTGEEDLLEIPGKVDLVCGVPGMGKSMLASRLSKRLKGRENNSWVMRVNLSEKNISDHLGKSEVDVENPEQLAILCDVKTEGLQYFLFKECLKSEIHLKLVIIFDAFDEIDEQSRGYVLDIVKSLRKTQVSKIYIMSRPVFKKSIQGAIGALAIELAPLSAADITEFMKGYWRTNGVTDLSDEKLHSTAEETVKSYKELLGENKVMLKNPLLLKIICDLEQNSLFDGKVRPDARRCRSLLQVYEKFAEHKYEIYAQEKLRVNMGHPSAVAKHKNEKRRKEFYDILGLLAVSAILGKEMRKVLSADKLKDLNEEGSLMKEVADNITGYGLIEGLSEGKARFIHRSFAEFFAARFLFNEVKTVGTDNPDLMKSVLDMYGKDDYRQVTYFLDSFASASFPMHSAIINGDYSSLRSTDEKATEGVDVFGRTLLHVAAVHGRDKDIWNILPINYDSLDANDKFGMTPIMYADKRGILFPLDKFCSLQSDENIEWAKKIPVTFENVTKEKDLEKSVLLKSTCYNCCSLLNVILSRFCRKRRDRSFDSVNPRAVDVDTIRDVRKWTVLFYARSKAVCELLLPYCDIRSLKYGETLLHNAIFLSYPFEVVEFYFLRLPVDANSRWYGTPLHASIREGNSDVVKLLLLRSGTDVRDNRGCNVIGKAFEEYNPDIVNLVLPNSSIVHKEGVPAFFYLMRSGRLWWPSNCIPEREILVSIYHSPKTMRQMRRDPDEKYTYQEQFEAIFPYLNIHDESDFMVMVIQIHFRKEQPRLVPLKQLLLRFNAASTDECGRRALDLCVRKGSAVEMKLLLPHSNAIMEEERIPLPPIECPEKHEMTEAALRWLIQSEHWR